MTRCANCGAERALRASHCPNCGEGLEDDAEEAFLSKMDRHISGLSFHPSVNAWVNSDDVGPPSIGQDPRIRADFLRLLDDSPGSRVPIIESLGEERIVEAVPRLLALIDEPRLRAPVLRALARIAPGDHAALFATHADDPDPEVALAAAEGLFNANDSRVAASIPRLLKLARGNEVFQDRAGAILSRIDSESCPVSEREFLESLQRDRARDLQEELMASWHLAKHELYYSQPLVSLIAQFRSEGFDRKLRAATIEYQLTVRRSHRHRSPGIDFRADEGVLYVHSRLDRDEVLSFPKVELNDRIRGLLRTLIARPLE